MSDKEQEIIKTVERIIDEIIDEINDKYNAPVLKHSNTGYKVKVTKLPTIC